MTQSDEFQFINKLLLERNLYKLDKRQAINIDTSNKLIIRIIYLVHARLAIRDQKTINQTENRRHSAAA